MEIKGVNLGNWLVLEKWMSPALFDGTTAEDEYYLPRQLSPEVYEARIKIHRSEYITERDFAIIKRMGMNAVRIPVPYFIFGDRPPFLGCVEELDKAFSWAEKYDLKILYVWVLQFLEKVLISSLFSNNSLFSKNRAGPHQGHEPFFCCISQSKKIAEK